jgi:hypothetical protein
MRRTAAIACFCLALWATPAWANDITLSAGITCTTGTGNITVSGTVTADSGWIPSTLNVSVWQDGSVIFTGSVSLKSSGCNVWTFSGDVGLGTLSSSTTYIVVGDVTFTNFCACPQPFRSAPASSSAK